MSFPRYPDYRDSKTPWFGNIPVSWQVYPFKLFIDRNDGGVWGDEPTGISDTMVLRSTEQTIDGFWKIDEPAFRQLSFNEKQNSVLDYGDLLITKSSGSSLHIGKTTLVTKELAKLKCCYSNFTQRIRLNSEFCPKFAWYLFNNAIVRSQFDLLSNSTTGLANLTSTMIGQITVPVAPINEQLSIINFLDQETTKIDALIAEQEKLIELLKEKRQAVISHAVTNGLDPNVKMKDSGVEWLGLVPAHWSVLSLRRCCDVVQTGSTPTFNEAVDDQTDGYLWFTPGDFDTSLVLKDSKRKIHKNLTENGEMRVFPGGSVLVVSIGATLGKVGFAPYPCSSNQQINAVIPNSKVIGYFLTYSLSVKAEVMRFLSNSSTIGIMNQEKTKEIIIAVPPLKEQSKIAQYLDQILSEINLFDEECKRLVSVLLERRSALISAAVTGQIDVRNVAITKEAA